jgi:hypothetical protein
MRVQHFLNNTLREEEKKMKTKKVKIFITLGLLSLTLIFVSPSRGCRYHYAGAPDKLLETLTSTISKITAAFYTSHGVSK